MTEDDWNFNMDEAPRDGTRIWVYRPVFDGNYIPEVGLDYFGPTSRGVGAWMRSREDCPPKAWIPLEVPQPPKEQGT